MIRTASLNPPRKDRLPGLDALRAFAVVWVIAFHLHVRDGFFRSAGLMDQWIRHGSAAVTLFFVISGFIITTLLCEEEDRTGRIDIHRFYLRRAFRILPATYVYLVGALVLTLGCRLTWDSSEWLGSLLFFRNLLHTEGSGLTGHLWSLSVEAQFYFIWPLLLVIAPARYRLWMVVALCGAAPIWRHLVTKAAHGAPLGLGRLDLIFDSVLVGAALALAQRRPAFRALLNRPLTATLTLFAGIALLGYQILYGLPGGKLGIVAGPSAILGTIAVVIKVVTEGRCFIAQIVCNWPPVVWIGRISFSLYLWQTLFCAVRIPSPVWSVPGCLGATLILAALSYYCIEVPMIRIGSRLGKR